MHSTTQAPTLPQVSRRLIPAVLGLALLLPALLRAQTSDQAPGRARATPQVVTSADYAYAYDALGRLTEVVYPDGTTLSYAYDARSNLIDITVVP